MNLWNKIKAILVRGRAGRDRNEAGSSRPAAVVRKMMQMLEMTREEEYSCAEVYALLDQYVEGILQSEEKTQLMPLVKHHLDLCTDCREEFEALLKILEASTSDA